MKKTNYMTMALVGMSLLMASCSDFLDREPYNKIDSSKFFTNESKLELYANGLYVDMMPSAEGITIGSETCDYLALSTTSSFLKPDFDYTKMSGWTYGAWTNLFRCNYLLTHIQQAESSVAPDIISHYRATARFWRAVFYFDKVKTYGNVPWYSEPIDAADSAQLYKTRDDREMVMDSVLADLNYACTYLKTDSKYPINRWCALALKSRVCLFEGTYHKYHSVNPSTGKPWKEADASTRWLNECVAASEELMNSGVFSLVTGGDVTTQYRSIFTNEKPNSTEVILAREYNSGLMATHNLTQKFNSKGNDTHRWSPTQDFINTYLCLDGSRFTDKEGYENKTFVENCKQRDYRLSQTVITPTYTKNVNGTVQRWNPEWSITMTGYQVIKYNMDDTYYEQTSRCSNSIPVFRYAEILLNEAEAKCELGEMDEKVWNKTIKPLRERAGVNGKAPETADPYLISYFNGKCTDKWLLEVRRERGIELFMEGSGLRYDDLMRWGEGEMLARQLNSIYIGEKNKAYDTNGDGKADLMVVDKKPSSTISGVTYIDLSKSKFYTFKDGHLYINNEVDWTDRKYLHPIPQAALVKNPNLKQNLGWEE